MLTACGVWIIIDAVVSLIIVNDKWWLWQLGRLVRIVCGTWLILTSFNIGG